MPSRNARTGRDRCRTLGRYIQWREQLANGLRVPSGYTAAWPKKPAGLRHSAIRYFALAVPALAIDTVTVSAAIATGTLGELNSVAEYCGFYIGALTAGFALTLAASNFVSYMVADGFSSPDSELRGGAIAGKLLRSGLIQAFLILMGVAFVGSAVIDTASGTESIIRVTPLIGPYLLYVLLLLSRRWSHPVIAFFTWPTWASTWRKVGTTVQTSACSSANIIAAIEARRGA